MISIWITDEHRRIVSAPPGQWETGSATAGTNMLVIDPEKKYQEILGFGGAFCDASCYTFSQLSDSSPAELFHDLFHLSEMAPNVCRTWIGSADSATNVYSYDDGEVDPDLTRFSIEHDREYILPRLRQAWSDVYRSRRIGGSEVQ
jgi:glucosylceramidase